MFVTIIIENINKWKKNDVDEEVYVTIRKKLEKYVII